MVIFQVKYFSGNILGALSVLETPTDKLNFLRTVYSSCSVGFILLSFRIGMVSVPGHSGSRHLYVISRLIDGHVNVMTCYNPTSIQD